MIYLNNYSRLLIIILFINILYTLFSYFDIETGHLYYTTKKEVWSVIESVIIILLYITLCWFFCKIIPNFNRVNIVKRKYIKFILISAIIINLTYILTVSKNIRYLEGEVYNNIVIFILYNIINYLYGLIAIKEKYEMSDNGYCSNKLIFYVWIVTWALTIDGLASALTIFCFIVLIKGKKALFLTGVVSLILLVYAIVVKFGDINNINLYAFVLWVVGRFLINAEQLFTAIIEPNKFGGIIENWNVISDQTNYALSKLLNINNKWEYKSYSEYLYFKLYGEKGGGASPGLILSGYLLGGIIFGPIIVFLSFLPAYLYIQSLGKNVGYIKCLVLVFIMKPAISDLPGVLSILSTALLYYVLVCIVGIIGFKHEKKYA